MSIQNGEEKNHELNANHQNREHKSETSSTTQVMETMRSIIVEL